MRHSKNAFVVFFLFVFAFTAISAFAGPAALKPDSATSATISSFVKNGIDPDSILMVEKLTNNKPVPSTTATITDSQTVGSATLFAPVTPPDSTRLNPKIFRELGNFHKAAGIYNIVAGALAVVAGAAILQKEDILAFSLSLVTLGGITVGIGVWEISIGSSLTR
jgi:hypothetical protein